MIAQLVPILIGFGIAILGAYIFRLDDDFKIQNVGLWNAHKYVKKPGLICVYVGYLIAVLSALSALI